MSFFKTTTFAAAASLACLGGALSADPILDEDDLMLDQDDLMFDEEDLMLDEEDLMLDQDDLMPTEQDDLMLAQGGAETG